MSSLSWFRAFARNNAFTNERLHAAIARLTPEAYVATRTSFFPSIHETAWHILLVDAYYLDAITGGGRGRRIDEDYTSLKDRRSHAAIRAAQHEMDAKQIAFVATLTEEDLARVIAIEREDHVDRETIGDTLMHMNTHAIHHRGQVHAMLSGTDVKPPQLDEYFLAFDKPTAERELAVAGFPT
jgi:uncharacterized damage-inducible protein DinB